ncbi:hypothetical protein THRCLA_07355, partial [Thraustotheca clavata]
MPGRESASLLPTTDEGHHVSYQTQPLPINASPDVRKLKEANHVARQQDAAYLFKYIIMAQVFVYLEAGAVSSLLLQFTEEFVLTPQDQGLLGAIVYIALSIGSPFSGYLFRRFSPKVVLAFSLVINNACVFLFAFTPVNHWYSKALLIFLRGLIGFTQAFPCVYAPLWVHEFAPKSRRGQWMSYLQGAVPVGVTFGYLLGSVVVWIGESYAGCWNFFCWRWPFVFQVAIVTPLALGIFGIPDDHIVMTPTRRGSMSYLDGEVDEYDTFFDDDKSNWASICTLFRIPVFTSIVLGLSALFFCVTGIQYWTTPFLTTNLDDSAYTIHSAYLVVSGTGPILGVVFGGRLIDYFGGYAGPVQEAKALGICMILGIFSVLAALPISYSSNTFWIAILLWTMLFCGGALLPPCSGIVIACAPPHLRPLASSVAYTSYNFLGYAASNYIPGVVMDFILVNTSEWTCDQGCMYRIGFRIVTWWSIFAFVCLTIGYTASTRKAKALSATPLTNSPYVCIDVISVSCKMNSSVDRVQSVRSVLAFDIDQRRYARQQNGSRWKRQRAVLVYTGRVIREVCRRVCGFISRQFSMCVLGIHYGYTRCFNQINPVPVAADETSTPPRRRITPPLAIFLCLVLFTIVRFSLSQLYFQAQRLHDTATEESIRSKILLNSPPGKDVAKAKLRWQQFAPDDNSRLCKYTKEGVNFVTDSHGFTCKRDALNTFGCCPDSNNAKYSCLTCDVLSPHCCSDYERCVSCCMDPSNNELLRTFLLHADSNHPVYGSPHHLTRFAFCSFRCRTSSASVQNQNSYRSFKNHCYGLHRPVINLDVVNSDGKANKSIALDPSLRYVYIESLYIKTLVVAYPIPHWNWTRTIILSDTNFSKSMITARDTTVRPKPVNLASSKLYSEVKPGSETPDDDPDYWKILFKDLVPQHPAINVRWHEPSPSEFRVRSKRYLTDSVKEAVDHPKCDLVWVDVLQGKRESFFHVAQRQDGLVSKFHALYPENELFILNILLPGSPEITYVNYFALRTPILEDTDAFSRLWRAFMDGTDEYRNARLKLIPRIVHGPWMVRKAVGTKPFILANALEIQWYRGKNYLEAVVDVSSDTVAKKVTSMCRMCVSSLSVDIGLVLEGQCEDELPEAMLGHVCSNGANGSSDGANRSARQARRLNQAIVHAESDSESASEAPVSSAAGFHFLQDSDSDSEKSSDDEHETVKKPATPPPAPAATSKSKKKANKKKKKKVEKNENEDDELLDALAANRIENGEEEEGKLPADQIKYRNDLLAVNVGALNADKEMKRLFGVKGARETLQKNKNSRNAPRRSTKRVNLVTPDDSWPRPPTFVGGGIRWTRVHKPVCPSWDVGCDYFQIDLSITYKKMQEQFHVLQMTHDPNAIVHFLAKNPYHIDALMQMSEVFQHHGQMDHSADCIKKCVYFLELAWGEQYNVANGTCRMDINMGANQAYFRALFFLMKQVGRRGCVRSAFEIAKLIWSMDPKGDPMYVLLCLDYYALAARQCQFVIDLYESNTEILIRKDSKLVPTFPVSVPVSTLPGLQFSVALARYLLGDVEGATQALAEALTRFPRVLKPLTDKCGISTTSKAWQDVLCSAVFANSPHLDDNGALVHLLDIYVTRHASLWKVNDIQQFLLSSATRASAKYTSASFVPDYPASSPLQKYYRAITPDFSDDVTTLPPDHPMLQPPQMGFDPNAIDPAMLAELENNPQAMAELQEQLRQEQERHGGNLPADANPLLLFLQTFLPWNRIQQPNAAMRDRLPRDPLFEDAYFALDVIPEFNSNMRVATILAALAAAATMTEALDRKLYGLNYASCPDDNGMPLDLDKLKPITGNVRMYSMDEACITRLYWHAGWRNMKIWLGMWSEANATIDSFDGEFQRLKNLVNKKMITNDNVVGIQVASEAIYRYYIQGQAPFDDKGPLNRIIQHYKDVRAYLRSQGLYFPVVITDIMDSYKYFPDLYSNTDVISVNAFAMWQKKTAKEGVATLYKDFQGIWDAARELGKNVVLHETGWSTGGNATAVAETGHEAQALYTKEFLAFAEQQNVNYYYFSSFDGNRDPEIEKHFGLFDNTRTMKPLIASLEVGTAPTAIRIHNNDVVLKAGSYKSGDTFGAISWGAPASGLTDRLDNEIWLYNEAGSKWLRSRSTNACLEGTTTGGLKVAACSASNANQNWDFTFSGLSNSGLSQCVQSLKLTKCLKTGAAVGIKKIDMSAQEIRVAVSGTELKLTEYYGAVSVRKDPVPGAIPETQIWYYDPINQQIKNKANQNHCLDAYEFKDNGAVHVWDCDTTNENQQWQYNDLTGQIMHAHKLGLCLSSDANGNVSLLTCD